MALKALNFSTAILFIIDIIDERVIVHIKSNGSYEYGITPNFFEYYYKNKLTDSIVYLISCQGFGNGTVVDYEIADILIKQCGVKAVLGFDNTVSQAYAYYIYDEITNFLLRGFSVNDSYNSTIKELGKTDCEFLLEYSKIIPENQSEREAWINAANKAPAHLLLRGDKTATLVSPSKLNGLVVESVGASNEPLANVTVSAESDDYKVTGKTDTNGKFTFKLPLGTYKISLSLNNYTSTPTTITVDENTSNQAPYIFFMKKDNSSGGDTGSEKASVHGMVKDETTGNAISGVRVEFIDNSTDNYDTVATATTGADGSFSVELPYGSYSMSFNHDDYEYYGESIDVDFENIELPEPILLTPKNSSGDDSGEPIDPNRTVIDSGNCGADGDNVKWVLYDDGELVISGTGAMADYSNVSSVPWYSYRNYIKSVNIGNSVTSIGGGAFSGCTSLTSVTIPNSVTNIGYSAFEYCSSLTSVTIPNSVTNIGYIAFKYCSSLTSVTIPTSVTSIDDEVFSNCTSLTSVTIPDSVTSIGSLAFSNCRSLTNIKVDADNESYSCDTYGVLFNKNKTKLIRYPIGNTRTNYIIPDSVTSVDDYAFCDCYRLTSVTIPDSVTNIGSGAFERCIRLTSVTIPDGVTGIGYCAFNYCISLTSVTIPDSVTSIGNYAFRDCISLTSVTIPDSVTSIGNYAFGGCPSLTDVYYSGTKENWNAITISNGNEPLTNATIHYNSKI